MTGPSDLSPGVLEDTPEDVAVLIDDADLRMVCQVWRRLPRTPSGEIDEPPASLIVRRSVAWLRRHSARAMALGLVRPDGTVHRHVSALLRARVVGEVAKSQPKRPVRSAREERREANSQEWRQIQQERDEMRRALNAERAERERLQALVDVAGTPEGATPS